MSEQEKQDLIYCYNNIITDDLSNAVFWQVLQCLGYEEEFKQVLEQED